MDPPIQFSQQFHRLVPLLVSFYTWDKWGPEKLSNLGSCRAHGRWNWDSSPCNQSPELVLLTILPLRRVGLENAMIKTKTGQQKLKEEGIESKAIHPYLKHCKWVLRALSLLGRRVGGIKGEDRGMERGQGEGEGRREGERKGRKKGKRERGQAAVLFLCSKWYNFPSHKLVVCVEKRYNFAMCI